MPLLPAGTMSAGQSLQNPQLLMTCSRSAVLITPSPPIPGGAISPGQPQRSSASFTQMPSQEVLQQNGSIAHTLAQQASLLHVVPCVLKQLPLLTPPQPVHRSTP